MSEEKCICGGYINYISVHNVDEEICWDIRSCINCGRIYRIFNLK